ncbi:pre-rRNA-processing protein TSR2 homolog isoform X1 [Hemicordylus capensis]|uniref:pre-rRNA-processing protein TSR2 homolog isoform X1 n=1 Tax=Hemicordylus capensis TaxID=884348 RepID=UPI002304B13E|nr:pre-rRNA-processing protein TSR2 homolog isoform X1 [Hemicordylus capensis]
MTTRQGASKDVAKLETPGSGGWFGAQGRLSLIDHSAIGFLAAYLFACHGDSEGGGTWPVQPGYRSRAGKLACFAADLEPEEVEDFLAELMNNEFDTMIEDGSLAQVSQQLCLFFSQCQQGEGAAVCEAIVQLAQKKQEARTAAARSQAAEESSSEEEQEPKEEAMECSTAPIMNGPQSSLPSCSDPDAEAGWTLVRKKKK